MNDFLFRPYFTIQYESEIFNIFGISSVKCPQISFWSKESLSYWPKITLFMIHIIDSILNLRPLD